MLSSIIWLLRSFSIISIIYKKKNSKKENNNKYAEKNAYTKVPEYFETNNKKNRQSICYIKY